MDMVLEALSCPKRRASLRRRLASKVRLSTTGACLEWTAKATCNGGYGGINAGRAFPRMRAHRVAWALAGEDLPAGKMVCHTCDNPKCCNPNHMFLGTYADNHADMRAKKRDSKPPTFWGEKHHMATIPDADIPGIRADARVKRLIAKQYGVSEMTIYRIQKGVTRCRPVTKE